MKKHARATLIGAAALVGIGTGILGAAMENKQNNEDNTKNNSETEIEQEVEMPPIEENQTTAEDKLNTEIHAGVNNVLNGAPVFSNIYDANNNENGLNTTPEQRENSWANAEAKAFYSEENQLLTREQAEQIIANGGEVVARFDNNNIPIGYVQVGQQISEDSGITK